MRMLLNIILITAFCQLSAISQSDLNTVWNIFLKTDSITLPTVMNVISDNETYSFIIEGQNKTQISKNPGIIKVDKKGNLVNKSISSFYGSFRPYAFFVENNKYNYFGKYDSKINFFTSNFNGDSLELKPFDTEKNLYATSDPIFVGDSLIQFISNFDNLNSYLYYFNNKFEKVKELALEKTNIEKYLLPYPMIKIDTLNEEIIMLYAGPTFALDGTREYLAWVIYDYTGKIKYETEYELEDKQKFIIKNYSQLDNGNFIVYCSYKNKNNNNKIEFFLLEFDKEGKFISNTLVNQDLSTVYNFYARGLSKDRIAIFGSKKYQNSSNLILNFIKIINKDSELTNDFEWLDTRAAISSLYETTTGNLIFTEIIGNELDSIKISEISLEPVSVSEEINNSYMKLSPNPATDFITINYDYAGNG
ncbi:MAG TPA: hypothetical protein PLE30_11125, partial [Candidatus Kapabacteria bacterium]|nr:hypothetical protein [Candidatus Kapabacteria bacterium]